MSASPSKGGGHLPESPINTRFHALLVNWRPSFVLHWSIICVIPHKLGEVDMTPYSFDDALSEAEDFIAFARQYQADGEVDEAEVSVTAAVSTLEQLLPPMETEAP